MKNFALTSTSFTGEITFGYDDQSRLISFKIDADLNEKQHTWILQYLPLTVAEMEDKITSVPSFSVIEVLQSVTFEMFWDKYNDKVRSSKKKSLRIWEKLTGTDQVKAHTYIHTYIQPPSGKCRKKVCRDLFRLRIMEQLSCCNGSLMAA